MSRRRRTAGRAFGAVVAAACLLFSFYLQTEKPAAPGRRGPRSAPQASVTWVTLADARFTDGPANDGDSFVVTHRGGTHTLRLYFVDCCEKRRYDLVRSRIVDQAAYFGGITETQVITLGRRARDRTKELLTTRPARYHTRWERVFDSERFYAHVEVQTESGDWQQLAAVLVAEGLARIHTKPADLPDGTAAVQFTGTLRQLERTARTRRLGGWQHAAAPPAD